MTGDYTIVDNDTGLTVELEVENMIDIQSILRKVKDFNDHKYPFDTKKGRDEALKNGIHVGECFDDTLKEVNKINTPMIDY